MDGVLVQLPCDHTMAQDMARQGLVPLTQRDGRMNGHMVTNTIGGHTPGVLVEVHKATTEPGDVLLLATDGLKRYVPDVRIAATLEAHADPKTACKRLVAQSLEQGGHDNVTVIVARYETLTNGE